MKKKNGFGKFLRDSRVDAGLTQKDISDAFGWTSAQFQSNIERNLATMPLKNLKKFCRITGSNPKKMAKNLVNQYEQDVLEALGL